MKFSQNELVDMTYVLGASDFVYSIYKQKFLDCRQTRKRAFQYLMERSDRSTNTRYEKNERTKTALSKDNG